MSNVPEKLWHALNLLEDLVRHGEKTEHPPAPQAVRGASQATTQPSVPGTDERDQRLQGLSAIAERVRRCTRCPLAEGRMNAVPGEGVLDPAVMVIGEGPGADEDRRGVPFVGRAGQYLDKWLDAIAVSREESAFIGNIVKCRPPGNRDPKASESDACMPYLREQIELIRPKTILSVGRVASGLLIGTSAGIGSLRGRTYYYDGIPLIPTYHPSGVLRNSDLRRPVWDDLKRLVALLQSMGETAGEPVGAEAGQPSA
ncbi:MAG: uracil-DNA glycosylase [Spirochaetia bacterium]